MNFRKFISGVSALAIAASAFAGMAVTASADTTNFDWTNSHSTGNGWTEVTTATSTKVYSTGGNQTFIDYDISAITSGADAVEFEFDMKVPSADANAGRFAMGFVDADLKGKQAGLIKGSWFGAGHTGSSAYFNLNGSNQNDYGADSHYKVGIDVRNKKVNYTVTSNIDSTKVYRSNSINPNTSTVDSLDLISFYTWSGFGEENATEISNMTITTYDLPTECPSYTAPTTDTAEVVYTGLNGISNWIGGSPKIGIDTSYGDGYNFYSRADFYLDENGQIKYTAMPGGGVGTVITIAPGVNGVVYNNGSNHNVEGTLDTGKWYTLETYTDMNGTFASKANISSFMFAIKDASTKETVATASGISYRNATNSAVNAVRFDTNESANVANAYAYYAKDYTATVASGIENGTVTVNGGASATAVAGEDKVTVVATPSTNYKLGTITVTGNDSSTEYALDANNSFTMPKENVTVSATFTEIPAGEVLSDFTGEGSSISGTNITDPQGVDISVSTTSTDEDSASIKPVSYAGKALAFTFTPTSRNYNDDGIFTILGEGGGTAIRFNYYNKWRAQGDIEKTGAGLGSGNEIVILPLSDNSGRVFVNGKADSTTIHLYSAAKTVSGFKVKSSSGNEFGVNLDNFRVMNAPDTFTITGGGVDGTYLDGTSVILSGTPESGYWYDGSKYYKVGDTYNITTSVDFVDEAPEPGAEVTAVSYNQYKAEDTDAGDEDLTAAKILVTVTGTINYLGLKYNGVTKPVQNFTGLTNTTIVLGAIVPGIETLTENSFEAVITAPVE